MKALRFCILPLVALVIVSFVIGIKEKQITRVVEETEVMQHSIRTAGTAAEYTLEGSGLGQHRSRALVEQGGSNSESQSTLEACRSALKRAYVEGVIIPGETYRVKRLAYELSRDDGRTLLDEIDAMKAGKVSRYWLGEMLVPAMTQEYPEVLVEHYYVAGMGPEDIQTKRVESAYSEWAQKDPQAAMAWYEERIHAGDLANRSLDGEYNLRTRIEQALISSMVVHGNQIALLRLMENIDDPDRRSNAVKSFNSKNPGANLAE